MWKHLPKYNLSDQFPRGIKEVDVLIGADYYWDFIGDEVRRKAADEPVGVQSIFGLILCGKTGRTMKKVSTMLMCQISEEESVNVLLRQLWQLDAIGIIPEENNGSSRAGRHCLKPPIQFNGE
ncbi:Zinc knuckle protein [Trichuris trichiura]|uniref:Zinc knuckle protein n=1 Tax=Trichuris trichiura TaxID=36087 RepID=A0A077ZMX1_TRITR|nr:Zinc knuckle protein [Trichuris trichiura]